MGEAGEGGLVLLPRQVSAQDYMMNHMVDAEEEEDVRLHLAALCGDLPGLQQTLCDPSSRDWLDFRVRPYLSTPLRLAVSGGSVECVEALVAAGAHIELEDVKGQTPLFVATSQRRPHIMKVLLQAGANPEGSRKNRCCPLLLAVRDGFTEGVKLLMEFGAEPEPFDQILTCVPGWPVHHAVVYTHFPCLLELVRCGAVVSLSSLPRPVCPKVVARLSIPHAILKYARERPEFVQLYRECGGNLLQPNLAGETCLAHSCPPSPALEALHRLSCEPLSLKSLCRVRVRQLVGRRRLCQLSCQHLPASLLSFLHYQDFSCFSNPSRDQGDTTTVKEK